ncbi:hypothetical protein [Desulfovibrio oxyclinae]|uniref:hypothetical protein n=1 Tax=Desulfovibrio oxyclinae TaxID=63560 RepID=UPI00036ACC5E|nr:hypothetical protein [Desulfovibrio oxyclinae]
MGLLDFLKDLTPLVRRAAGAFDRARRAERNGSYAKAQENYRKASVLYRQALEQGSSPVLRDRLKAGISCVRCGKTEEALEWLAPVIESGRYESEARLHAGYAHAKLDDAEAAAMHWEAYPADPIQAIIGNALKEQARKLRSGGSPQEACEAVAAAWNRQDQQDRRTEGSREERHDLERRRGF